MRCALYESTFYLLIHSNGKTRQRSNNHSFFTVINTKYQPMADADMSSECHDPKAVTLH